MVKRKGMVVVQVRFWTSDLKDKAVWDSGTIYLPKQAKHGITSTNPEMFNRMEEIGAKINVALKKQKITVVHYQPDTEHKKILR